MKLQTVLKIRMVEVTYFSLPSSIAWTDLFHFLLIFTKSLTCDADNACALLTHWCLWTSFVNPWKVTLAFLHSQGKQTGFSAVTHWRTTLCNQHYYNQQLSASSTSAGSEHFFLTKGINCILYWKQQFLFSLSILVKWYAPSDSDGFDSILEATQLFTSLSSWSFSLPWGTSYSALSFHS
jgi:hypothetical protein